MSAEPDQFWSNFDGSYKRLIRDPMTKSFCSLHGHDVKTLSKMIEKLEAVTIKPGPLQIVQHSNVCKYVSPIGRKKPEAEKCAETSNYLYCQTHLPLLAEIDFDNIVTSYYGNIAAAFTHVKFTWTVPLTNKKLLNVLNNTDKKLPLHIADLKQANGGGTVESVKISLKCVNFFCEEENVSGKIFVAYLRHVAVGIVSYQFTDESNQFKAPLGGDTLHYSDIIVVPDIPNLDDQEQKLLLKLFNHMKAAVEYLKLPIFAPFPKGTKATNFTITQREWFCEAVASDLKQMFTTETGERVVDTLIGRLENELTPRNVRDSPLTEPELVYKYDNKTNSILSVKLMLA